MPAMTRQQKVAIARAKALLDPVPQPAPNISNLEALDALYEEARRYLVDNEATIDPRLDIEITFKSRDFSVCFERKDD